MEIKRLPSEAAKVYLALCERSQSDAKIGMTLNELSRMVGFDPQITHDMLDVLVIEKRIKHEDRKIVLNGVTIPFSCENTDDTRLEKLEAEVRRLSTSRVVSSGLNDIYRGTPEGDLYEEIENGRGYAIQVDEALLLGKMIQKFGPERVKQTYRQMKKSKNPIRATYAALQRGIKGQGAKSVASVPYKKVTMRDLDAN